MRHWLPAVGLMLLSLLPTAGAQDMASGVFIGEIEDKDGDQQILMESKWISMHLMPSESMMIMRFVFRPTGNDILKDVQPKFIRGGGGLFQDNLWEQDWRFQELRSRFYDYKILDRGPQEAKIVFQTKTDGFVGYVNSGIISRLLSDIIIRRTITLRADTPFFRVDVELINADPTGVAKVPMYWLHNSSLISAEFGDQVDRPSARGVRRMGGRNGINEDYIWDFNHGWTARVSEGTREGIVYLMDYDYLLHLYNCGTATTEWMYDNVLILKDRPWHGTVYIIPTMGLTRVDYANRYFVAQVEPKREGATLSIDYALTSSYEKAQRVSLNTSLTWGHLKGQPRTIALDPAEISGIGLEPKRAVVQVPDPPPDPFVINTTAYVELPDGKLETFKFGGFHVGDYGYGDNVRADLKTPVALLERAPQQPFVPVPATDLKIDRTAWRVFGLMGCNSRAYGVEKALSALPDCRFDRGDTPGYTSGRNALTDFPYDYERLFGYRVLLYSNCDERVLRRIGTSILVEYARRGGGLVFLGGDSAFTAGVDPNYPFAKFVPFLASAQSIQRDSRQLGGAAADHPIFKGVDLGNLPWCQYYHALKLNPEMEHRVLLKAGDAPFIVESEREGARIMTVLCVPFYDPDRMPEGKTHYLAWKDWPRLLGNVIRYAGGQSP